MGSANPFYQSYSEAECLKESRGQVFENHGDRFLNLRINDSKVSVPVIPLCFFSFILSFQILCLFLQAE